MKTQSYLYPLRKVLVHTTTKTTLPSGTTIEYRVMKLDCGHLVHPPSDMYGEYFPNQRRCRHCWNALTPAEQQSIIENSARRKQQRKQRDIKNFQKEMREWRASHPND